MGKLENRVRSANGEGQSNDKVFTPEYILSTIERVLGPIGLDPCSNPKSIVRSTTAIMLPEYYPAVAPFAQRTVFADGLQVRWSGHGLVWCNFPYSDPLFKLFLAKATQDGDEIAALVPVRTGNRYWTKTAALADVEVWLPRVKHHGQKTHAPFNQWLLYFGGRVEAALGLGSLGPVRVNPRHTRLAVQGDRRFLGPGLSPGE